jgi:hypothetical protein
MGLFAGMSHGVNPGMTPQNLQEKPTFTLSLRELLDLLSTSAGDEAPILRRIPDRRRTRHPVPPGPERRRQRSPRHSHDEPEPQ